ncbi:transcription factor SPT20 homolog [Pseudorasbora parva]|uniref:transcription factor SPT20 homolog n=1 Tax=Pseudorasbora parva TaxID=51549 RepID=UPI00351F64F2
MDQILGTRPTSSPVNIIESFEESTETTTDESSELNDTEKSSTADNEESGGAGSTEDSGESMQGQATPRIHGRKRKAKSDRLDLQTFLHHQRELLKEFQDSEHNLQQHEMEAFEKCMKASQEAEERRFQALQAQQQATNNMFFQLMGTLISAVCQDKSKGPPQSYLSPPPGGPVIPTPSVSVPQSNLTQVNLQPQQYIPVHQPSQCEMMRPPLYHPQSQNDAEQPLSSLLHEANSTQHFFNL